MRRLLLILILTFSFQSLTKADDIRDFQIEGMSIGDSLLDYFSKSKINNKKNSYPDKGYIYKSRDYYALTYWDNDRFETYDGVQIVLKDNDKKYIIYSIAGLNILDIEKCYSQFTSIENELDTVFKNSKKVDKQKRVHVYDKSSKSTTTDVYYYLIEGSYAALICTDWSDTITKSKNWDDSLRLEMGSTDFKDWLNNEAYN
jgi:hypothetical protein